MSDLHDEFEWDRILVFFMTFSFLLILAEEGMFSGEFQRR